MNVPPRSVLLVAGRLGAHDEGWSVRPLLDRLERQGVAAQVLCTAPAAGNAAADARVVACPNLARRWRVPLTVRGLRFGDRLKRPDLCHVLHSRLADVGLALAEHWRVPYVQTVDEFVPADGRLRLSRRWGRRLIATSRELADDLSAQLGVPSDWVATVNPGVESPDDVDPPCPSPSSGSGRRVAVIGTAGPLVAASGVATFLNAARKVTDAGIDAEFVIAGLGPDEVDLRRRADRLRIADRVTFAGIPAVGSRFWGVLDVFCQPSLAPTVPRTLATALAHGVPTVASDIEGLRALVTHDRNGLRVPGDSGALARSTLALLADPDRARLLGAEGRALIRRDYHPDAEARLLAEVYAQALLPVSTSTPAAPRAARPVMVG